MLGDSDRFRRLSQEYAALGPVVEAYDGYRAALDEIEGLELLKADSDPEMRALAEAVDLATFRLWSIPGRSAEGDAISVRLTRAGTEAALDLEFRRRDGRWSIMMPGLDDLAAQVRALREARPATGSARLSSCFIAR